MEDFNICIQSVSEMPLREKPPRSNRKPEKIRKSVKILKKSQIDSIQYGTSNSYYIRAKKVWRERIMCDLERIYKAQLSLALGYTVLLKKPLDENGNAVGKAVAVTDPDEILAYYNGEADEEFNYYEIVTAPPNNSAIDSMMNRAFGRPREEQEEDKPENKKRKLVMKIIDTKAVAEVSDVEDKKDDVSN